MNYITFDQTVHATYIKVMSQKEASSRYVQHFSNKSNKQSVFDEEKCDSPCFVRSSTFLL